MSNLFEGVYVVDTNRKIVFWNDGAEMITGYSKEEVMESHCYDNILNHIDENGTLLCFHGCPLHHTIASGEVNEAKVFLSHKQGHRVPVSVRTQPLYSPSREVIGAIEAFTDDRYRKDLYNENKRLQEMLITDELTNISNRRYVDFQLSQLEQESREFGFHFGVLFMDIDHFKQVNDTYGHDVGDDILKLVANTIHSNLRREDTFGRYGGEEFVMLCRNITKENLFQLAEKLRIVVKNASLRYNNKNLHVTISIGGTVFSDTDTIDNVLKRADQNMYQAKQNGRNQTVIK